MTGTRTSRIRYGLCTAGALTIAVVFSTIGDGVDVPEATGLRALAVNLGHSVVWMLLTVAFAIATALARWSRVSNVIGIAAGVTYVVFLAAVFIGR